MLQLGASDEPLKIWGMGVKPTLKCQNIFSFHERFFLDKLHNNSLQHFFTSRSHSILLLIDLFLSLSGLLLSVYSDSDVFFAESFLQDLTFPPVLLFAFSSSLSLLASNSQPHSSWCTETSTLCCMWTLYVESENSKERLGNSDTWTTSNCCRQTKIF